MRLRPAILVPLLCGLASAGQLTQVEVFRAGEGGYHTYRIPALLTAAGGTLLAFCEGRMASSGDAGNIDILLRRSLDRGKTWQPVQKIADFGSDTIGNPTPVLVRETGQILLALTSNPGNVPEKQIINDPKSAPLRTVWIMRSSDKGASWSKPEEITASAKRPDWAWYATGPGNGIQMRNGRIVIPCDHSQAGAGEFYSHVIYSDDRGATWKLGGVAEAKTNESAVIETRDGRLLLNMRSYHGKNRRAVQRSSDGGLTWGPLQLDDALIEPVCQASLISAAKPGRKPNGKLLFSNPAATTRTRLTVRFTTNDGRAWSASRVVNEGPSAYSSLAMLRDGTVGLLYERGDTQPYDRITFARFDLKWVQGR